MLFLNKFGFPTDGNLWRKMVTLDSVFITWRETARNLIWWIEKESTVIRWWKKVNSFAVDPFFVSLLRHFYNHYLKSKSTAWSYSLFSYYERRCRRVRQQLQLPKIQENLVQHCRRPSHIKLPLRNSIFLKSFFLWLFWSLILVDVLIFVSI